MGPQAASQTHRAEVPNGYLSGNLGVLPQVSDGRQLVVGAAEIDGAPGWLAVRTDKNGTPDSLIGLVARANEQHDDTVIVPLSRTIGTGIYWVTMHIDAGVVGRYEYPGPDRPLVAGPTTLTRRVSVTVP